MKTFLEYFNKHEYCNQPSLILGNKDFEKYVKNRLCVWIKQEMKEQYSVDFKDETVNIIGDYLFPQISEDTDIRNRYLYIKSIEQRIKTRNQQEAEINRRKQELNKHDDDYKYLRYELQQEIEDLEKPETLETLTATGKVDFEQEMKGKVEFILKYHLGTIPDNIKMQIIEGNQEIIKCFKKLSLSVQEFIAKNYPLNITQINNLDPRIKQGSPNVIKGSEAGFF